MRKAGTGSGMFLTLCGPMSENATDNLFFTCSKVFPEMQIPPISARPSSRAATFTQLRIANRQILLDRNSTSDSFNGTAKFNKHSVTGSVENAAIVFADQGVDDFAISPERVERPFFVSGHKLAVADDIGGKDCRKFSVHSLSSHRQFPCVPWVSLWQSIAKNHRLAESRLSAHRSPDTPRHAQRTQPFRRHWLADTGRHADGHGVCMLGQNPWQN